jgi:hypothetical protein
MTNYFVLNYIKNKNLVKIIRWIGSITAEPTKILRAAICAAGTA